MKSRSHQFDQVEALESWLSSVATADFRPTLAVVFMGIRHDRSRVQQAFARHGISVFGSSSWGEFTEGDIRDGTIAVLLMDMARDRFDLRVDDFEPGDETKVTAQVVQAARERFERPSFMVLTADLRTNGEAIVHTFESLLGPEVELAGAGAGMDLLNQENFAFTEERHTVRGMVTLILDADRVRMASRATCGWQAVGASRVITRSEGMWVHELDGVPALDAILRYIGREDMDLNDPKNWELEVNTLPLQLQREKGDPIMRPALVFDEQTRSVMCTGEMREGDRVRFSIEPDDDVIESVLEEVRDLQRSFGEVEATVYFTCVGRHNSLGPRMNREIRQAARQVGSSMVGLLSSGEMARATGGSLEFNALTSCCVLLREVEA